MALKEANEAVLQDPNKGPEKPQSSGEVCFT